jgi:hypothetical protein
VVSGISEIEEESWRYPFVQGPVFGRTKPYADLSAGLPHSLGLEPISPTEKRPAAPCRVFSFAIHPEPLAQPAGHYTATKDTAMAAWKIHPIVMGTKRFDKGMMTYQHGYGTPYVIPIYSWYLEGGDKRVLVDTGEMTPVITEDREKALGGKIYTFEQGLAKYGLTPEAIDIVIHTHLHNDHCENDAKCVNARFFVHEMELTRIHDPHPLDFRYSRTTSWM